MRDTRRDVHAERETEHELETEEAAVETPERHAGGHVPAASFGAHGATASQLAYEEDENERELKQKVSALCAKKFGGDYKKAFDHYDTDGDGAIGKSELVQLLSDAGVGSGLTRGIWASKIIEKLDSSTDKKIQWGEFESVFRATA